MGCHTWVYIPKNELTEEDILNLATSEIKTMEFSWLVNTTKEKYIESMLSDLEESEQTDEVREKYAKHYEENVKEYERDIKELKKNPSKVIDKICYGVGELNVELDGTTYYYFDSVPFGDNIYRVIDYPEVTLTNKEDALKYAFENPTAYIQWWDDEDNYHMTKSDDIHFGKHIKKKLDELYEKYPHAVIDFG